MWPSEGGGQVAAVRDLSFSVRAGEVFGLLGPNGAGKSTSLRLIAGLVPPTSGSAIVCGHDVRRSPEQVRAHLGYLSATSGLPARLTCREVLALFAGLQGVDDAEAAAARAIDRFGLADVAGRPVQRLSTGMRQRVRIACATVHDPPVLILDEPTAGLDVVAVADLLAHVEAARDGGAAIVFSTHVLAEAEAVCDRIGVLCGGELLATGTPAELMARTGTASLHEAFLALVRPAS